jgi:hypothetical protein
MKQQCAGVDEREFGSTLEPERKLPWAAGKQLAIAAALIPMPLAAHGRKAPIADHFELSRSVRRIAR